MASVRPTVKKYNFSNWFIIIILSTLMVACDGGINSIKTAIADNSKDKKKK